MSLGRGTDSSTGAQQPIAIIGIGCRFPGGANSPEQFWQLLTDGGDAVGEIMPGRWDAGRWFHANDKCRGRIYTKAAGCIEDIDKFDAGFFGIAPREALTMDPQQRVLLEVAWEAMEDAGIDPRQLAGTDTGVFVGICQTEYATLVSRYPLVLDSSGNTGGAMSIAANRISYLFDLHGPSYAVDTACSSSMVAVDAACKTIWRGESSLALAGGVNLMVNQAASVGFSRAQMLSPTGRCRPFDADADGYVRSEGAGVVLLKRLEQAIADGDRIYATIAATGVNQDGRTNGLSLPNRKAQAALIRQVLAEAELTADQIQYVEAHGTGTPVGDPIECFALGEALGKQRKPDSPVLIGSVKSNVGHLEGASGMAGLVKLALSLHHRKLPVNAQYKKPNPRINFQKLNLKVQDQLADWPEGNPVRIAGINSFGFGGTNAHALLQENQSSAFQQIVDEDEFENRAEVLVFSARSSDALTARARQFQELLDRDLHQLNDLCHAASVRSAAHLYRLAVVGKSGDEMSEMLEGFLAGERRGGVITSRHAAKSDPRIAFVFSGNGPQWWGMARQLLNSEPVFRNIVDKCDRGMQQFVDWSLREELNRDEQTSRMQQTAIAQPALFAVQLGLCELLKSWGVRPAVVFGHSVGEVAAAAVAGILDFDTALRVIYHRSRTQEMTAGAGAMAAVNHPAEDLQEEVDRFAGKLTIAAVNSPGAVTVSGETNALDRLLTHLSSKDVYCQRLRLNYAFHSHYMDTIRDEFTSALSGVQMNEPSVRFLSAVTGTELNDGQLTRGYWWDNIRKPVQFLKASQFLADQDIDAVVEIGPHAVVSPYLAETFAAKGKTAAILPTLKRYADDRASLLTTVASLFTLGQTVDWRRLYPRQQHWVDLPRYPWSRERFWVIPEEAKQAHPLLGTDVKAAEPTWQQDISIQLLEYLADHQFEQTVIFPAAGYVELCLAVAKEVLDTEQIDIDQLDIHRPLTLPADEIISLQTTAAPDGTVQIHSRPVYSDVEWTRHARGKIRKLESSEPPKLDLSQLQGRFEATRAVGLHYQQAAARGLKYGPDFQGVKQLWVGESEALSQIQLSDRLQSECDSYLLHPAALDACFQTTFGVFGSRDDIENVAFLPVRIGRLRCFKRLGNSAVCHVFNVQRSDRFVAVDARILDDEGETIALIDRLCLQQIELGRPRDEQLQYELEWLPANVEEQADCDKPPWPEPQELIDRLSAPRSTAETPREQGFDTLEQLALHFIRETLDELSRDPGFNVESLVETNRIQPRFRALTSCYLQRLQANGLAIHTADGWELPDDRDVQATTQLWQEAVRRLPNLHLELLSLRRCRRMLPAILRDEANPAQVGRIANPSHLGQLFQVGRIANPSHLQQLFELGLSHQSANERVLSICQQLCSLAERPPRILVVDAASSGVAARLLDGLDLDAVELVLADSSSERLQQLESRFERYENVNFLQLDYGSNLDEDAPTSGKFDVVVSVRTLWSDDVAQSAMRNLIRLLADNGIFVFGPMVLDSAVSEFLLGPFALGDIEDGSDSEAVDWPQLLDECGLERITEFKQEEHFTTLYVASKTPATAAEVREPTGAIDQQIDEIERMVAAEEALGSPQDAATSSSWLIFSDCHGVGDRLADTLQQAGEDVHVVRPGQSFDCLSPAQYTVDPANREDFVTLLQTLQFKSDVLSGIVYLWGLDVPPADQPAAFRQSVDVCNSAVSLIQALDDTKQHCQRLWLAVETTSACREGADSAAVFQLPLWGLGRVVRNERPDLKCTLVAVSAADHSVASELMYEIQRDCDEAEIMLRHGERFVRRLSPVKESSCDKQSSDGNAFRLELGRVGQFQRFAYREVARPKPPRGKVEIEVAAAGLNFKDVMWAMGMLPGEVMANSFAGPCYGFECAGTISAVGEGVSSFKVGDKVMAFAPHSFGRYAMTVEEAVCQKPAGIDFTSAATIPVTYLTAEYALAHLARVRPSERVLIHGGAGGVGMAAIQIVQSLGGEVFATAGSREKRDYLESLGVKHVFDSRSLAFADNVLRATGGEGIDVVLNSLAGDAMDKSLSLLRPFGRFLEIGKRDFVENNRLRLRPFQNNISFFGIDADQLLKYQPEVAREVLSNVVQKFQQGHYHPLPHVSFAAAEVPDAFRFMQRSQHIGKVVVSMSDSRLKIKPKRSEPVRFKADASYLIVGGLGGIGRTLARWLVVNGAGQVVLTGRSAPSEQALQEIEALRNEGAQVEIVPGDVTDKCAFAGVLEDLRKTCRPLRAVIHAAMVLDDASIGNLDRGRLENVMACKTIGAWNLHELTKNDPLDHFVMFSSFSSVIGNPGQLNYAAANAFLDELAAFRRRAGLPALTVNWGLFGDIGYAAGQDELVERLARMGAHPIGPQQAFRILGKLMADNHRQQVTVCDLRWNKWRQIVKQSASPTWSHLAQAGGVQQSGDEGFQELLEATPPDQVPELVRNRLARHFASVLGTSEQRLDFDRPITELGLDSLMGVELRVKIENDMGIELSMMKVFSGETISSLTAIVVASLHPNSTQKPSSDNPQQAAERTQAVPASSGT